MEAIRVIHKQQEQRKEDKLPIFFKDKRRWVRIEPDEILWMEAADNCALLHLRGDDHIVGRTLKDVMLQLSAYGFVRVHRSFAVNLNAIDSIDDGGLKVGEKVLPIGRKYRADLLAKVQLI